MKETLFSFLYVTESLQADTARDSLTTTTWEAPRRRVVVRDNTCHKWSSRLATAVSAVRRWRCFGTHRRGQQPPLRAKWRSRDPRARTHPRGKWSIRSRSRVTEFHGRSDPQRDSPEMIARGTARETNRCKLRRVHLFSLLYMYNPTSEYQNKYCRLP